MFCYACGAKIPENTKFCPACGAEMTQAKAVTCQKPYDAGRHSRFDALSILMLVVSVAMLLSMLSLPLFHFTKGDGDEDDDVYTVSLYGENYMTYREEEISAAIKTDATLIITCTVAIAAFVLAKKNGLAAISATINLLLIYILESQMSTLWRSEYSYSYSYTKRSHDFAEGMTICTVGAFVLLALAVIVFIRQKTQASKQPNFDTEE